MKPISVRGGAIALALALLLGVAATTSAHEGLKEISEAAREQPAAIETVHDHGSHGHSDDAEAGAPHDGAPESDVPKPIRWLGKFHPPVTHFPIALLTAAALAELLFLRTGAPAYRHALHFCVRLGAAAAVLAALLGWFFSGFRLVDEEWVMTAHRWGGTSVALSSLWLLVLSSQMNDDQGAATETRFRAVLFTATGLVGATGFLGGALLYGLDHYAW